MQVSVEATQGLERRLTLTIPGIEIVQELTKRLESLQKTVRIAGFRPGKIPMALIQKRFSAPIRQEVIEERAQSHFKEAVIQQQLRLVNTPAFELLGGDDALEGDVRYTATFEIYPEITLAPLGEVIINRPEVSIEESDIDIMVEHLRRERQTWLPVIDRPAMLGDRVKVDFKGILTDGQEFSGNVGNDVLIVLGDGIFVGGFERHLVGIVAGETRTVEVTFPVGYHNSEVAGKPVVFNIVVKSVESAQLPALEDVFVQDFDARKMAKEDLRPAVRHLMEKNFTDAAWQLVKDQMLNALYQHNPLELPSILVTGELERLRTMLPSNEHQNLEEHARYNVTLGLLINHIIWQQHFTADPERVRAYIRMLADDDAVPADTEREYLSNKDKLKEVEAAVIQDLVVEWLLGQVQVKKRITPFSALVNHTQQSILKGPSYD